jgi:uncharacterized protein (DUF39 family)
VTGLKGIFAEASVSGCGEINFAERSFTQDNRHRYKGSFNGAPGYIIGAGTRVYPNKPNLSAFSDMKKWILL